MKNIIIFTLSILSATLVISCRGDKSAEPPIILIRNMQQQSSYGPQAANEFFKDGQASRKPVLGTVAQGEAHNNSKLYLGIESNSTVQQPIWVKKIPITLTKELLEQGQKNYNVYCSPCHGYAANNDGLVTKAAGGSIRPADLHAKNIIELPAGKIYYDITNGVNSWNMPGFAEQMTVQERWAVVAYVRALQASNLATKPEVQKK